MFLPSTNDIILLTSGLYFLSLFIYSYASSFVLIALSFSFSRIFHASFFSLHTSLYYLLISVIRSLVRFLFFSCSTLCYLNPLRTALLVLQHSASCHVFSRVALFLCSFSLLLLLPSSQRFPSISGPAPPPTISYFSVSLSLSLCTMPSSVQSCCVIFSRIHFPSWAFLLCSPLLVNDPSSTLLPLQTTLLPCLQYRFTIP